MEEANTMGVIKPIGPEIIPTPSLRERNAKIEQRQNSTSGGITDPVFSYDSI
jgi:hypothetical protein